MATKDVQLELHEVRINMPEADPSGCTPVSHHFVFLQDRLCPRSVHVAKLFDYGCISLHTVNNCCPNQYFTDPPWTPTVTTLR